MVGFPQELDPSFLLRRHSCALGGRRAHMRFVGNTLAGEESSLVSWVDSRAATGTSEHECIKRGRMYLTVFWFWLSLGA